MGSRKNIARAKCEITTALSPEGVVVIPQKEFALVLQRIPEIQSREKRTEQVVDEGLEMLDSVRELLNSDKVEYVEE